MAIHQTYILTVEHEMPQADDACITLEIEFGYEPGARTYSDEPPAAGDVWLVSARVLSNLDAVPLTDEDVSTIARDYLDTSAGYERAYNIAEG